MDKKTVYEEVATLRDPGGLVCVVNVRQQPTGFFRFSLCVQKEYEREGRTERANWIEPRHIPAAVRLLEKAEKCIAEEEDRLRARRRMDEVLLQGPSAA